MYNTGTHWPIDMRRGYMLGPKWVKCVRIKCKFCGFFPHSPFLHLLQSNYGITVVLCYACDHYICRIFAYNHDAQWFVFDLLLSWWMTFASNYFHSHGVFPPHLITSALGFGCDCDACMCVALGSRLLRDSKQEISFAHSIALSLFTARFWFEPLWWWCCCCYFP